jgi:uncharacterized protein YijF (DUF1287 family)
MRILAPALGLAISLTANPVVAAPAADRGIFPDLDDKVPLEMAPPPPDGRAVSLRLDEQHGLATVYFGDDPVGLYPLPVSPAVRAALGQPSERRGAPTRDEDRDGDGIVDRLDVVRGSKKLLVNRAAYHERYLGIRYPGGDVPRSEGVCSDTIVRALRNAGIDLQREIHEDLIRARAAYPNVEKIDASINHRRVKTLLVWFKRHTERLARDADFQPGDVVFFDTFPDRAGAEHVGIVADRRGPDGRFLVVNNWTDGTVDAEMALLSSIPVTDHFRVGRHGRPGEPRLRSAVPSGSAPTQ